ncbi:MAG: protein phosphatase 2C domain-containing protein [Chloroflexota bacterium]
MTIRPFKRRYTANKTEGSQRSKLAKVAPATAHRPNRVGRGAHSDRGRQRSHNEDAYALPPPAADEAGHGTLLVVADGVGGLAGGAAASREAVHYLQALYYAQTGPDPLGDRLRECVQAVNLLNRAAQQRLGQTGQRLTTLVAAVVYHETIWVANVGDSRAYLIQTGDQQRRQLTEDHSFNQADSTQLTDSTGEPSGAITQAIGLEEQCQVDIYRYQWRPGDRLILCSDGLACLTAPVMVQLVLHNSPQAAAEALVAQANKEDGSDNSTAVVVSWEKSSVSKLEQQGAKSQKRPRKSFLIPLLLAACRRKQ